MLTAWVGLRLRSYLQGAAMAFRFSLKWLLAAMFYLAVAAAALSQGWWAYADALWTATILAFGYAALAAIVGAHGNRTQPLGFVILAASFVACVQFAPESVPVARLLALAGINDPGPALPTPVFGPLPPQPATGVWSTSSGSLQVGPSSNLAVAFPVVPPTTTFSAQGDPLFQVKLRAAHSLATMLIGLVGCVLATLARGRIPVAANGRGPMAALLAFVLSASASSANDITYVDATDGPNGNTQLWDGGTLSSLQGAPVGNDNQWSTRPFGNGGDVFTSNDGRPPGPEDAPALVTTIGRLTPGSTYLVYAYFWTDQHNWHLRASLDSRFTAEAIAQKSAEAAASKFSATIVTNEGNRTMRQAPLGRATADANGEIRVWLDDLANAQSGMRTWYDGVGYRLAPASQLPAPGTMLALALMLIASIGGLFIWGRRRRNTGEAESDLDALD
jgi:hypothetical protein